MFETLDIRSKYGFWRVSADTGSPTPAYELLGQATTPDRSRGQAFGDKLGRLALQYPPNERRASLPFLWLL